MPLLFRRSILCSLSNLQLQDRDFRNVFITLCKRAELWSYQTVTSTSSRAGDSRSDFRSFALVYILFFPHLLPSPGVFTSPGTLVIFSAPFVINPASPNLVAISLLFLAVPYKFSLLFLVFSSISLGSLSLEPFGWKWNDFKDTHIIISE